MELCPLSAILLLIVLLQCGQTEERPVINVNVEVKVKVRVRAKSKSTSSTGNREKPKPTVRVEPQSAVYTGDTVTLTCELQTSLTGWKFFWYKNSTHLTAVDENTNTINITVSNRGTEEYKCLARGEKYHTLSDPVQITVRERPKPKVKVQPADHVFIKERVTLTCDIESGGVWRYEWFRNNVRLGDDQWRKKYEISSVDQSHEGVYSCKGTQSTEPCYSETSDAVRLTVSEKPKPTVRVEPQSTVYTGDTVTLTCELQTSLTGWKFFWYKNSTHLTAVDENTNTINVTVSNRGTEEYKCLARGEKYHTLSDPVQITVRERPKPKVKVQPADHVFIRERVTLTCDIESGGDWRYEWFRNNERLGDDQWRKKYEISSVDQSHEGVYSCKGTQSTEPRYSETSDAVSLTVSGLSDSGASFSVLSLLSRLLAASPYLLVSVILAVKCYRAQAETDGENRL